MPISQERVGEFLKASLEFLSTRESATRQEVMDHLEQQLQPTPEESTADKNGRPDWATRYLWSSVGMVKAGWLTKDGYGVWRATPEGSDALRKYAEPESFRQAVHVAYKAWEASNKPAQRRAWLVRGSSVLGVNVVPEWLEQDYCSLAGSQLRPIEPGIDTDELRTLEL